MAFLGKNFHWFIGVVEDRFDPLKGWRLRVRCLGIHTDDKLTLPTVRLAWRLYYYRLLQQAYLVLASRLVLL